MIKVTCAACSPPRLTRVPVRTEGSTAHGSVATDGDSLRKYGVAVVRTAASSRGHVLLSIEALDPETELIHVDGTAFLWVVEAVLARLPKLKTIQVIPSALDRFGTGARARCDARGVQIVAGHIRPEMAWSDDRIGNPLFTTQRRFLVGLAGEQKALFEELLALGFDGAKMAARYFCLAGEEYVPQRFLAEEYGYAKSSTHAVSGMILAVLFYLDGTLEVGEVSKRKAAFLKVSVARLRPLLASAERRQQLTRDLGVPALAASFPLARADVFGKLLVAHRTGRLAKLKQDQPRAWEAVTYRFGIDRLDVPTYRTLIEVGALMGDISRERVRQLEEKALECLGIVEE